MLNGKIQQGFIKNLRDETYQAVIRANWAFFLRKRKSDIINSMTTELTNVAGGTYCFFNSLHHLFLPLYSFVLPCGYQRK